MHLYKQGLPGLIVAAMVSVAFVVSTPAVNAQTQNKAPPPSATEPSAGTPNIPEEQLDKAAAAMKNVVNVKQSYQSQIEAAAPADKERLAGEANNAAIKAVTDQGLSVEEYTSIMRIAQRDPEVRQKILQRLPPSSQ
jgi:hypothetical protein